MFNRLFLYHARPVHVVDTDSVEGWRRMVSVDARTFGVRMYLNTRARVAVAAADAMAATGRALAVRKAAEAEGVMTLDVLEMADAIGKIEDAGTVFGIEGGQVFVGRETDTAAIVPTDQMDMVWDAVSGLASLTLGSMFPDTALGVVHGPKGEVKVVVAGVFRENITIAGYVAAIAMNRRSVRTSVIVRALKSLLAEV